MDEAVKLILGIARFQHSPEMYEAIHHFFESLLRYRQPAGESPRREDVSADNFMFVLNELFLYAIAALIRYGRFDGVNHLTRNGYFSSSRFTGKTAGPFYLLCPLSRFFSIAEQEDKATAQ
jgi:hypothetical protein